MALLPVGEANGPARVAAACVTSLDGFRAGPGQAELDRRRAAGLTEAEERRVLQWGYPYVLDAFRFHVTLTAPRAPEESRQVRDAMTPALDPLLPRPFTLDAWHSAARGRTAASG